MGSRVLTLKYATVCADCGAALPVGSKARYYGPGKTYGTECHAGASPRRHKGSRSFGRTAYEEGDNSPGAIASHYDRKGAYATDGTFLGTDLGSRCEDAPCCGCCS